MRTHLTLVLTLAAVLFAPPVTRAQEVGTVAVSKAQAKSAIELGLPFANGAILQREMPVPVWGWSPPGTQVTVEFAGQKETARAGADGKWMLRLKPLKASAEPAELLITDSEGRKVVLTDILVGEVWMASGQSNMEWFAGKSHCSAHLR